MFEYSFGNRAHTRKRLTVPLAIGIHGILLCCLILLPLVYSGAVPDVRWLGVLIPDSPAPPGSPDSGAGTSPGPAHESGAAVPVPVIDFEAMVAPQSIPSGVSILDDGQVPAVGLSDGRGVGFGGGSSGIPGGIPGGVPGGTGLPGSTPPPPAPPPEEPPSIVEPIRVSGGVVAGYRLTEPDLEYPALAMRAGISGTVVIKAVISPQGRIRPETLHVVSGHPILARAAAEAVVEWRYRPYMLNGEPVEIATTISVNYSMN